MVKKLPLGISVIMLLFLLAITGCGKDDVQEVVYKKGMPKEDSPSFKEFMRYELGLARETTLSYQDHAYTITRSTKKGIQYYKYTDKELEDFYKPLFLAKKDLSKKLYDLAQVSFLEKRKINNELGENLPEITLNKRNVLKVKTTSGEKNFELPSAKGKKVFKALEAINKDNMLIQVEVCEILKNGDYGDGQSYYLFIKQDLSKHQLVKEDELHTTLGSGKLKDYLSVFPKVTEDGAYLKLFDNYIFEEETNKVRKIKDTDILSEDGKYVYINGAKQEENFIISDGIQQIQTVDNYLKGNKKYEAQFKLDYKSISNELGFKTPGVSSASIHYFNENYVVLSLSYHGVMVGTAGSVNVLIDLQKNKQQPTAYLVDLGIE